jgi:hypothetical protein
MQQRYRWRLGRRRLLGRMQNGLDSGRWLQPLVREEARTLGASQFRIYEYELWANGLHDVPLHEIDKSGRLRASRRPSLKRSKEFRESLKSLRAYADGSHIVRQRTNHEPEKPGLIPAKGDRIELVQPRMGVRVRGTVFYSDQLQILVKWDDGRSEGIRPGIDRFRIIGDE